MFSSAIQKFEQVSRGRNAVALMRSANYLFGIKASDVSSAAATQQLDSAYAPLKDVARASVEQAGRLAVRYVVAPQVGGSNMADFGDASEEALEGTLQSVSRNSFSRRGGGSAALRSPPSPHRGGCADSAAAGGRRNSRRPCSAAAGSIDALRHHGGAAPMRPPVLLGGRVGKASKSRW